jgi:hypothetical protein
MTTLAHTLPRRGRDGASVQALAGGIALALLVPVLALSGLAVPLPSAVYRLAVDLIERTEALSAGLTGGSSDSSSTRADTIRLRDDEPAAASRIATPGVPATTGAASARARRAAVLPGGKPETVTRRPGPRTTPPSGTSDTSGTGSVPPAIDEQPTPRSAPTPGGPTAETPTAGGGGGGGGTSDSGGGQTPPPSGDPAPPRSGSSGSGSSQTPPATIGGTVGTVGETVGGTVSTVGETIGGPVGGTVGTVGETVETTVGSVGETVDETVATVEETVDTTVQTVGGLLGGLLPPKPPKK